MKIIGRGGPRDYDDFLVEMSPGELAKLTGRDFSKGIPSVGSTVAVDAVYAATRSVLNLAETISYSAKSIITAAEHAQQAAAKISAAVIPPPPPPLKIDRGDTDSGAM